MKPKIVIADVRSINRNGKMTGHYLNLAQNYIDVLSTEFDVFIAGGPIYKDKFHNYLELPFDVCLSDSALLNKVKAIINCLVLFRKTKHYTIILQSNAVVTTFFAMLLSPFRRRLFMIQYNTMALDSKLKRFLHCLVKTRITGVLCPSAEIGKQYCSNYLVVPDYIVTPKQIDELSRSKTQEKIYDIAIVGIITPDKGIIQSAEKLSQTKYHVLIAGRPVSLEIEKELRAICEGHDNIVLKLEYIDDAEYDTYIRKSRYCLLNYTDAYSEHSSGVIFDALYRGTPIIGRKCRFLQIVADENMGHLYDDISTCDFEKLFEEEKMQEYEYEIYRYLNKELKNIEILRSYLKETL